MQSNLRVAVGQETGADPNADEDDAAHRDGSLSPTASLDAGASPAASGSPAASSPSSPNSAAARRREPPPKPLLAPSELAWVEAQYDEFRPFAQDPVAFHAFMNGLDPGTTESERRAQLLQLGHREGQLFTLELVVALLAAAMDQHTGMSEEDLETLQAYTQLGGNEDRSGCVDANVLRATIRAFRLTVDVDAMIAEVDEDGSGRIEFGEFEQLYRELRMPLLTRVQEAVGRSRRGTSVFGEGATGMRLGVGGDEEEDDINAGSVRSVGARDASSGGAEYPPPSPLSRGRPGKQELALVAGGDAANGAASAVPTGAPGGASGSGLASHSHSHGGHNHGHNHTHHGSYVHRHQSTAGSGITLRLLGVLERHDTRRRDLIRHSSTRHGGALQVTGLADVPIPTAATLRAVVRTGGVAQEAEGSSQLVVPPPVPALPVVVAGRRGSQVRFQAAEGSAMAGSGGTAALSGGGTASSGALAGGGMGSSRTTLLSPTPAPGLTNGGSGGGGALSQSTSPMVLALAAPSGDLSATSNAGLSMTLPRVLLGDDGAAPNFSQGNQKAAQRSKRPSASRSLAGSSTMVATGTDFGNASLSATAGGQLTVRRVADIVAGLKLGAGPEFGSASMAATAGGQLTMRRVDDMVAGLRFRTPTTTDGNTDDNGADTDWDWAARKEHARRQAQKQQRRPRPPPPQRTAGGQVEPPYPRSLANIETSKDVGVLIAASGDALADIDARQNEIRERLASLAAEARGLDERYDAHAAALQRLRAARQNAPKAVLRAAAVEVSAQRLREIHPYRGPPPSQPKPRQKHSQPRLLCGDDASVPASAQSAVLDVPQDQRNKGEGTPFTTTQATSDLLAAIQRQIDAEEKAQRERDQEGSSITPGTSVSATVTPRAPQLTTQPAVDGSNQKGQRHAAKKSNERKSSSDTEFNLDDDDEQNAGDEIEGRAAKDAGASSSSPLRREVRSNSLLIPGLPSGPSDGGSSGRPVAVYTATPETKPVAPRPPSPGTEGPRCVGRRRLQSTKPRGLTSTAEFFASPAFFTVPFRAENRAANFAPPQPITPRGFAAKLRDHVPVDVAPVPIDTTDMARWLR